jgi:pimeloyl-ACP methyl ester carboxylesterase
MSKLKAAIASAALLASTGPASADPGATKPGILLVHGAFVDGSGWSGVHRILEEDGYSVTILQNPTTSLADDVAAIRRVLAAIPGPVVLVGHSYGGVVITEAGSDPKVSALVYIAAFAPDAGESVSSLVANAPPGSPALPIVPLADGYLTLDRSLFPDLFAADVPAATARFMADSQQPWGARALEDRISVPAWKSKPSFFLVASEDRVIPPAAQRGMAQRAGATIAEAKGSHAVYVSDPASVAALIEKAAGIDISDK